jgi:uncharacterized protein
MQKEFKSVSWFDVETQISTLVDQIRTSGFIPKCIYGVSRGGLVPGVMLSHRMNIPFEPLAAGESIKDSRDCLIIDDLFDSGTTIKKLASKNPFARFATLYFNDMRVNDDIEYFGDFYSGHHWLIFPWESFYTTKP